MTDTFKVSTIMLRKGSFQTHNKCAKAGMQMQRLCEARERENEWQRGGEGDDVSLGKGGHVLI